jgi:hypothetical protein
MAGRNMVIKSTKKDILRVTPKIFCRAQREIMIAAWTAYEENLLAELKEKGLLNIKCKFPPNDAELTPETLKIINKKEKKYLTTVEKYGMIRKVNEMRILLNKRKKNDNT